MTTFDHYKQVVPPGFLHVAYELMTPTIPNPMIVTLGFGADGYTPTEADMDAVAEAYADNIMSTTSDEIVLERVTFSDAGGAIYENDINATGTDTAEPASVNCALLVEKRTGQSGRRNRGRMYVPCIGEAWVDAGGNIDSGQVADLQVLFDAFHTDLNTIDVLAVPVVLHSKGWNGDLDDEPADPGNAPDPTPITSFLVRSKIGTQRRRIR